MTPAARINAAIAVLAQALAGEPVEKVLTGWARSSRFAGSGDRQAIRDLVFDGLRRRRSLGWIGAGAAAGADPAAEARAIMLGALHEEGVAPAELFTGTGHAPAAPDAAETRPHDLSQASRGVRLDCADWLLPLFDASAGASAGSSAGAATGAAIGAGTGAAADAVLAALQTRAPVTLRVNTRRADRSAAIAALAGAGITAEPLTLSPAALRVTAGARRISTCAPYLDGRVELQDAASQAVADGLPLTRGARVLDYCAGGGGKVLAMAAREPDAQYTAHDAAPARMRDLPARAARAGARVALAGTAQLRPASQDLVFCDAPCSGSGSWRRAPQAKWTLTPARLADLVVLQAQILDAASRLVAPGGTLAYATCSLFPPENDDQVRAFLRRNRDWRLVLRRLYTPDAAGDGFFVAHLTRE